MKTCLILLSFLLLASFTHAQPSPIAKAYFEAIKDKDLAPLDPYFLTVEQQIKIMYWPDSPEVRHKLDSFNTILRDTLLSSFQFIHEELQQQGIALKKSHLTRSNRKLGQMAIVELEIAHKEKKASIFVRVIDVNGKDYHFIDALPSLENPIIPSTTHITINQVQYPIWAMRRADREKASQIIQDNQPLTIAGNPLPPHKHLVLVHGVITKDQQYYAHAVAIEKEGTNKWVILVDLEQEKIALIEKEKPNSPAKPIQKPNPIPELLQQLEQKKGKEIVEQFQALQQQRMAFDLFMDSLRKELITQTGGYEEKYGQQMPAGKKNKVIPTKILIEEGKASAIQQKMLALQAAWLQLAPTPAQKNKLQEKIRFDFGEERATERGETWQEYMFGSMPLAAVFPMLRRYQLELEQAEIKVLETLLEEE